jgi:uncharacterized protein (DUF488 family)
VSPEASAAPRLLTIGHSNHELAVFLHLLQAAGATAVVDVRSAPYSPRYPQFNREILQHELTQHDLAYVFLGDHLGGRPQRPSLYDPDGRVNYERVRQTATFQEGVAWLLRGLDQFTPVLLCAEEDPLDCHRGLMITPALVERGLAPVHLRGDGSAESTAAMEERLLAETGVGAGILDGLFAAAVPDDERRRLLAEAYRVQARRRAFRWRPDSVEDSAE